MNIRNAGISDAGAIYALINFYAEQEQMLFRSMADIYEKLQSFLVADSDGRIVGCCALEIIWSDLAEIKSLAVSEADKGTGIGRALVEAACQRACRLGLPRIFALTMDSGFFERLGFERIDKNALPMKVWGDCARCSKQQNCDETAVIKTVLRDA